MDTIAEPEQSDDRFECLRCKALSLHHRTPLSIRATNGSGQSRSATRAFADDIHYTIAPGGLSTIQETPTVSWQATICLSCRLPTVWRGPTPIYPAVGDAPAPNVDMPGQAREIYDEAAAVLPVSPRASAALARAALEALLRELVNNVGKTNLNGLISAIRPQVSPSLWKLLTVVRFVGNKVLHEPDSEELIVRLYLDGEDSEMAPSLLATINQVVDELISRPKQVDVTYELIPEAVRQAAEREGNNA